MQGIEARRRASAQVLVDSVHDLTGDTVLLDDDDAHHLGKVLRLRAGESVVVTDGAGSWRMTEVGSGGSEALRATSAVDFEPQDRPFTIASAIPKGDRVEWLVQKVTELGADRVTLLHAERSATRWKPERAEKQLLRLQRIADEATRQSRRVWRTTVDGPVDAIGLLPHAAVAEPGGSEIVGDEDVIAIGPEGGWNLEELLTVGKKVRITSNILRIETAAVAAATLRMVAAH